ncbi:unnamed protein product [Dovyalis caffra]|uniref:Uncharacterized protein n=1 Tax=Dovyalis caffra TaxID=77055 RepID=A0AAV1RM13_9ROSI|nr:unnamed protein product [Dovyalis caffra]
MIQELQKDIPSREDRLNFNKVVKDGKKSNSINSWELSMVVKVLGRSMRYKALCIRPGTIWNARRAIRSYRHRE